MAKITPASEMLRDSDLLRAAPVQARSNLRLTALLDAAAALIHESGYEELTTAAVAGKAGASIGTVYRYFDDRVKLLKSLATRNYELTTTKFIEALTAQKPASVEDAVSVIFDMYLGLFRNEPGYRSLRMGDVLDLRPVQGEPASRRVAETIVKNFQTHYGTTCNDDCITSLEVAFVTVDAQLARAFMTSAKGDETFIAAARATANAMVATLR